MMHRPLKDSLSRWLGGLAMGCLALGACVAQTRPTDESVAAVVKAIEAKDCQAAAKALNAALAEPSAPVLLLAASMFEHGICLKANAERAVRLLLRVQDEPGVASRLTALYAAPASGPDKGAALWWAARASLMLPPECAVPPQASTDADAFAQALSAWPAGRLDACVFVGGVLAALDGEFVLTAPTAPQDGLGLAFVPAQGKLTLATEQLAGEGFEAGTGIGAARSSAPGFQRHESWSQPDPVRMKRLDALRQLAPRLEQVGQAALARYPRPPGIDPRWQISLKVTDERH